MTLDNIFKKVENKEELTENEASDLIYDNPYIIEHGADYDNCGRWECPAWVIFNLNGKFYLVEYYKGLTECQEDEIFPQVVTEVKQVEETITVKKWIEV